MTRQVQRRAAADGDEAERLLADLNDFAAWAEGVL